MRPHLPHGTLGIALLLVACSSGSNTSGGAAVPGSGGASVTGSGGASPGSGGVVPSSVGAPGSGGAIGSGGADPQTGGAPGTGGTSTGSGGTTGSGGAAPGTGGDATGGGGNTSPGTCQKGQTKPAEVVIMGESFYAITPQYIQNRIQDNARKAGSLGASDKYRNVAVSAQNMNYIATTEWTAATQGGATVKYVIMDGGGIDCLGGGCSTCASTFKTLLGKMATAGVQDVIYTRYPEPGNPPGSNASLKACLDGAMPMMQTTCEGSTSPKCHWVDLRPVWVNGDTTDGLHPTQSGGDHVGDLVWSEMVKLCFAQ